MFYSGVAIVANPSHSRAAQPGVAGWCWDRTGIAAAPLLFASLLLMAAVMGALLFQRLAQRAAPARI
jgi:hypothetical protein